MKREDHLGNVFCAYARSITTCKVFGDVVFFDITYLTNKYDVPFAHFVGVNHHGQIVLFGSGRLSKGDIKLLFVCSNLGWNAYQARSLKQ